MPDVPLKSAGLLGLQSRQAGKVGKWVKAGSGGKGAGVGECVMEGGRGLDRQYRSCKACSISLIVCFLCAFGKRTKANQKPMHGGRKQSRGGWSGGGAQHRRHGRIGCAKKNLEIIERKM